MDSAVSLVMAKAVESSVPDALEQQNRFVAENLRRIFLLIYRMVNNVADAQDLTQEVFIKALQRQDQIKDPAKAAHWLSRVATNTAIDFLRRHGRVVVQDIDALAEPLILPPSQSPEALALRAERETWLREGMTHLTPRERAALILRDVEGLSADEVADALQCSKATVRSHISNARIKFRRFMEKRRL
jgi:RNA polymerase sigma-70 factor, ECF subfamily